MNELLLTVIRFGVLALLWLFILLVVGTLRRDLRAAGGGAQTPTQKRARANKPKPVKGERRKPSGIEILDGPLAGATMALTGADIIIGRAPDCSIVLTDDYISSKHTRLRQVDGTWFVEDLQSTNGTWINRGRISAAVALAPDMVISVGRTKIKVTS